MRSGHRRRQRRRTVCAILQQHCRTHRATDCLPMPVLTSLSLLSTAVSGALQLAGEVADALHSAKSGSVKKPDSHKQTQSASQLANTFAAYLAAAANPANPPAPSANVPVKGASKSVKEASATLSSLSVVLAVGPATAVTASKALQTATGVNTSASKTAHSLAPTKGAVPTVPNSANTLHPTAKQPSAPGTKTLSPSTATQNLRTGSLSERLASTAPTKPAAPVVAPAPPEQTKAEVPVLALHDVPVSHVSENPPSSAVSSVSSSVERTAVASVPSPHQPGEASHSSLETLPALAISPQVHATQTKPVGWAESSRPATPHLVGPEDSAHPTASDRSSPQTTSAQPAMTPLVSAVVSDNQPSSNTTGAGSNSPETNVPVAEQLTRAFVAQASTVNREGRTDFHLRLDPPQLGSVQIHLTATEHTVSARVIVSQEGTRQLIEGHAHQLRQSLAESGLVLGTFDVTRDSGGFSHSGHHQPPEPPPPRTASRSESATATHTAIAKTASSRSIRTDGIDILA